MTRRAVEGSNPGPEAEMIGATDELRVPLLDWVDPAAPDGPEGTIEAHIVRSID